MKGLGMNTFTRDMRLVFGILAATASAAWAQAPVAVSPPTAESKGGPKILCDAPVFDFGAVMEQDSVSHKFVIKNVGGQDLKIEQVRTTCGCTTATLSTQQVPPGGQVELSATLSLVGRRGRQLKSIFVTCNDPASPQYRLDITGEARREVDVAPQMIVFDGMEGDPIPEQKALVTVNIQTNVLITGVDTNAQSRYGISVETLEPGKKYSVTVRLNTNSIAVGTVQEQITVRTDYPKYSQFAIPIFMRIQREVTLVPAQLLLVSSAKEETETPFRDIYVNSLRQKPIEVVGVENPDPASTVESAKLSATQYRVRIRGMKASKDLNGKVVRIRVKRWDGKEESFDVPIQVQIVEAPDSAKPPPGHP